MKLLTSSSSSSTSSSFSTSPFTSNMNNTTKNITAGCLNGIFRRILCSGSLPTHPSDQITEEPNSVHSEKFQTLNSKENLDTDSSPNIVARLMGLDSMPELNQIQPTSSKISRSRSMNSVENLRNEMQSQHRRIKSTLSFREIPTYVEMENEDFFILSFENVRGKKEPTSGKKKFELGFGELKKRSKEKLKNEENKTEKSSEKKEILKDLKEKEKISRISKKSQKIGNYGAEKGSILLECHEKPENVTVKSKKVVSSKVVSTGRKLRKRSKKKYGIKEVDLECSSEDSSPVSVLDRGQFLSDPLEVPTSEEDLSSPRSGSRRKIFSEIENYDHLSSRNDDNLMSYEQEPKKKGANYLETLEEICRLTEEEIVGSNWVSRGFRNKDEDFGGIVHADFESHILDSLLGELVNQLAEEPLKV